MDNIFQGMSKVAVYSYEYSSKQQAVFIRTYHMNNKVASRGRPHFSNRRPQLGIVYAYNAFLFFFVEKSKAAHPRLWPPFGCGRFILLNTRTIGLEDRVCHGLG